MLKSYRFQERLTNSGALYALYIILNFDFDIFFSDIILSFSSWNLPFYICGSQEECDPVVRICQDEEHSTDWLIHYIFPVHYCYFSVSCQHFCCKI